MSKLKKIRGEVNQVLKIIPNPFSSLHYHYHYHYHVEMEPFLFYLKMMVEWCQGIWETFEACDDPIVIANSLSKFFGTEIEERMMGFQKGVGRRFAIR